MENIFSPEGLLANYLEGYEPRPGQLEMAQAVFTALEESQQDLFKKSATCLIVEAETGLGKTLAYLVPAATSGRKIVVSTNTRNLQDQILQREIPFIKEHIAPDLKALCVKGRQNYLCLYRYKQHFSTKTKGLLFQDESIDQINTWLQETPFGDRSELKWLKGNSPLWQKINCESHLCPGSDCPDHSICFLNRLRREAAKSQLLIVNHHLLFSDLAVKQGGFGEVLPRYEAVIFDEAHHVENVASTFFGFSLSKYQIASLVGDIERSAEKISETAVQDACKEARTMAGTMEKFVSLFPSKKGRFPLSELIGSSQKLNKAGNSLLSIIHALSDNLAIIKNSEEPWENYLARCEELATRLETILAEPFDDIPSNEMRHVHWYERSEKNLTLSVTPIDVSEDLQKSLFSTVDCCIFTSATLSAGGNFNYFSKRLGLPESTNCLRFPSPFDYGNRSLLYIPEKSFPEPSSPSHTKQIHAQIETLLRSSAGRALVLFTSISAMKSAYYALQDLFDFPLLLQGTAPRQKLLNRFTQETESVLFAVASFWEGVDVPGEALSMVIIDKIPFEVPSDPVIMARINQIQAAGANGFFDFQIPRAILALRQGVGRLMRSSSDRGVIAILDVRLFTKGYGRHFLKSLPQSPICRNLDQVNIFLQQQINDDNKPS